MSSIATSIASLAPGETVILPDGSALTRRPAGGFWLRGAPDPQAGDGDPGDPEEDPEESALPFGEAADEAEAPREWPGWQVDQATASLAAGRLADAAGKAIPDGLAAAWLAHLGRPVEAEQPPPPPAAAGAWAATQAVTFQAAVEAVVPDLLAEGYLIGARAAVAMVFQADVDWDDWTPGDPDTARKILGDDGLGSGLRAMLADSQIRLAGIAEDRFAEFAQLLAKAAAEGWSVDHLAGELHNFGSDPVWARRTATTELARAISEATLDQYEELDVERHEWMVAGEDPQGRVKVCPICAANAAAGPVPVGDRFPSGEVSPPGHFSCRCCLAPAIDLDGYGDTLEETTPGWVWDVEEARYVRTAAGAKKYGLPIGSEIRRKNNRDGWHDDTARAKRRAYYARAKARAQARHAARMEREKQQRRELRAMKSAELRQAMLDAIAADDMRAFNRLAGESDRRDAARDTARAKRQHQREAEERRKAEEYEQLLTAGYDDEEAAEVVYGVPVERQRRQAAITSLRRSGYEGKNLEQLARAAFRANVYEQFRKAEDDTNGYMVNPEGRRRNVDPLALFTGPEARARKWASPELREWWDLHGRPSFADYVDALVNGGALRRHRDDFHR